MGTLIFADYHRCQPPNLPYWVRIPIFQKIGFLSSLAHRLPRPSYISINLLGPNDTNSAIPRACCFIGKPLSSLTITQKTILINEKSIDGD
jgi:hypothetical protein